MVQVLLDRRCKLLAHVRDIENVEGLMSLRVDHHYFDVAARTGDRVGEIVQEASAVRGDNLHQRGCLSGIFPE